MRKINFIILIISLQFQFASAQTILFFESFEDNDFTSRGWYDGTKGTISTTEHINGSSACFECKFLKGQRGCSAGSPGRHLFAETDELYVSYWVKYSANWEGSNKPYHPHEFNIMTNIDDKYVGPAITHLTLYIEQNEGKPLLALQDSKNVDQNCILLNNGNFIGCNGDFNSYQFTENRSIAACNGIQGGYDRRDCFNYGGGYYYSARVWDADTIYFEDTKGPHYKNDWHHVEAYFKLNSIVGGKGITDGKIRYWYDSKLLISYDDIIFRTAQFPDMKLNQFLIAPYIGDGSPVEQTMWIDDLWVATSPLNSSIPGDFNSQDYIISPNPASDFIEITVGAGSKPALTNDVKIFDVFGQNVLSVGAILELPLRVDVSCLPPGIYVVRIGDTVTKFIKL